MKDHSRLYKSKIKKLINQQSKTAAKILALTKNMQEIEIEIERIHDEEFIRTGVITWSEKFEIRITYDDLLRDLVKEIEGKMIDPKEANKN